LVFDRDHLVRSFVLQSAAFSCSPTRLISIRASTNHPSAWSVIKHAPGAVSKDAPSFFAFKCSEDINADEYEEALLTWQESDRPESLLDMLAS